MLLSNIVKNFAYIHLLLQKSFWLIVRGKRSFAIRNINLVEYFEEPWWKQRLEVFFLFIVAQLNIRQTRIFSDLLASFDFFQLAVFPTRASLVKGHLLFSSFCQSFNTIFVEWKEFKSVPDLSYSRVSSMIKKKRFIQFSCISSGGTIVFFFYGR